MQSGKRDAVCSVLRRERPARMVYAPNYWQWFTHQQNHGTLPEEIRHCRTQLDLIRHLGLDVFSRNIYCDPTRCWFGGLAEETWDGVEVQEQRTTVGRDIVTEKTYRTRAGTLGERLRYIFSESTLVQEKFLLDEAAPAMEAFVELVRGRRWKFQRERFEAVRREVGDHGVVNAGELFSPLKLLHLAAGAANAVFLLQDYPELCREVMDIHKEAQLNLVRQLLAAGVQAAISMDNLDAMFHPPHYVEKYSAGFYEQAARLCRESGAVFMIHACGQQRVLLPLIGSLGVDGLEGVAFPPLGDVQLDEAMRLAGDRMIITGGISAAEFGRLTTRESVSAYVRESLERMKPFAHRFMLSASCNTPYTASWETIRYFRDAYCSENGM